MNLRQALAQPEQEPVGYVTIENISSWAQVPSIKWFKKPTQGPLYTAPPKRECVGQSGRESFIVDRGCWERGCMAYDCRDADAVTIEAKLKEKNT
jgi:hypothetical protein